MEALSQLSYSPEAAPSRPASAGDRGQRYQRSLSGLTSIRPGWAALILVLFTLLGSHLDPCVGKYLR
jgi:hypothetical protein